VELGALVALRSASRVLGLARAELAEILRCLWTGVLEKLECDAAERLSSKCDVEEDANVAEN
jgi:hypothetical protein